MDEPLSELRRRTFLQVLGSGLLVTVAAPESWGAGTPVAARLFLNEDGTITALSGKVEEGQGPRAELTQAAAEELHVACRAGSARHGGHRPRSRRRYDRRQPDDAAERARDAAGGGHRTGAADRAGRAAVEGGGGDARRGGRRDHDSVGPDDDLRRPREGGGRGGDPPRAGPRRRGAHASRSLEVTRPGGGATERAGLRHRHPCLSLRRPPRGDAVRPRPAAARSRGDARRGRPRGGEGRRWGGRDPRGVLRRLRGAVHVAGDSGPRRDRPEGLLEDPAPARLEREPLRAPAREGSNDRGAHRGEGIGRGRVREGGPGRSAVVSGRLHPARPDGAARRRGRVERRPPDGVGRLRRALPGAGAPRRGARHPAGPGSCDRARHGRGIRREAHGGGGRGGGAPGPSRRETGLGALDARRGVQLGVLSPGSARRLPRGPHRRGHARRLGLHEHQPGRRGTRHALLDPELQGFRRGNGVAAATGLVPVPGGDGQQLRPRVLHGRAGGGR